MAMAVERERRFGDADKYDTGRGQSILKSEKTQAIEDSAGGRKVAIGAIASGAVNIIKVAIQLLLLPVMARLLGPDEFGLYALALPTVSLVGLLADGGLGATLAREQESSSLIWSSAFWALLLMGTTLAIGSSIFGSLLGYLAQQPRLPGMIALLSLSLVFLTLSVVPGARLTRRKNLAIGAGADLASTVIGAIIAVTMAWYGAGAWSLAVQYVATYAIRAALLNLAAFHFPSAEFSFSALRPHLVSGGIMIATRMSEYAGRITENFLLDRIFGTALLGNYTFANQVSKFATDSAANVVWAALYVQAPDRHPAPETLSTVGRGFVSRHVSCGGGGAAADRSAAWAQMGRSLFLPADFLATLLIQRDLLAIRTDPARIRSLRYSVLVHRRSQPGARPRRISRSLDWTGGNGIWHSCRNDRVLRRHAGDSRQDDRMQTVANTGRACLSVYFKCRGGGGISAPDKGVSDERAVDVYVSGRRVFCVYGVHGSD